jgi:hypothetical protein
MLASNPVPTLNQQKADLGIPRDSLKPHPALDIGSDRDPWCDPNGHWAVSMRIRNAARNAPPGLTNWSPRPLVSAFVGAVIGSSAT